MGISARDIETIRAALELWKEELAQEQDGISKGLFFLHHTPLSIREIDELSNQLQRSENVNLESANDEPLSSIDTAVRELQLTLPTHNTQLFPREVACHQKPEFGEPIIPVLIRTTDAIQILLGTHDADDTTKPEIHIERHPNGWMIYLYPVANSDPVGYLYFLDDGRSFLRKEYDFGTTLPTKIIGPADWLPEFDGA